MAETYKRPNIKEACHVPNRLSDLENLSAGLEKCQKSLNDYLDSKRNAFPRYESCLDTFSEFSMVVCSNPLKDLCLPQ